ncbi:MAG: N-methylhydantoinase A [Candidatus Azotimanducaceae bacterium]|jgi:N-methylhydantoinase A
MSITLLGIDTGGTFTDFVAQSETGISVHKVLSTPSAPEDAVLRGIEEMGLNADLDEGRLFVIHGTTVATNAALQSKGVKTVYITNKGLKDVLSLGRQTRSELYNLNPKFRHSIFDENLMFEVNARVAATGETLSDYEEGELKRLKKAIDAVSPKSIAINLLFSFISPEHEKILEALFRDDYFVSRSSTILPEIQEFERGMTTWINAWVGPLIKDYIGNLESKLAPSKIAIMQSSGLTIAAALAANRAVNLLLSGPAGGLAAAHHLGKVTNIEQLITFDMGGTSTDVALMDGHFKITNQGHIGELPIGVPMADIHTIGAGGGSIAYIDSGGLLRVGPESAGALPGPACYDQGGTQATVTDANLVLGRLTSLSLAGGLKPSLSKAKLAVKVLADQLELNVVETASGIIALANEHMSQALRVISVQRGYDPRKFTLVSFGGAGGLHLCDLAESLDIHKAMVPIHAGVLSALGLIASKAGRELVKTKQCLVDDTSDSKLGALFKQQEDSAITELRYENVFETKKHRSLDLRYLGQSYTINVPYNGNLQKSTTAFHRAHEEQYGHQMDRAVELLNYRLHIEAVQDELQLPSYEPSSNADATKTRLAGITKEIPVIDRGSLDFDTKLSGPVLITEPHATSYIKPFWTLRVDQIGNLLLSFDKTGAKKT